MRPDRAGPDEIKGPLFQHDFSDRICRGQHRHHYVGSVNCLIRLRVGRRATLGQRGSWARRAVPDRDREALVEQTLCKSGAHGARAEDRNSWARGRGVGGVTHCFFSFQTDSGEGPPTRTSLLTMSSILRSADGSSWSSAPAIASSMCLGLRVPTMATWTAGLASVQAM